GGCGHCDVCRALDEGVESTLDEREKTTELVRMALSAVARANKRGGLQAVAEMLRGAETERTKKFGFTRLSTFGLVKDRSHAFLVALLRALLAAGWIDLTPNEHPVPYLTGQGREVMMARAPARIVLPAEPRKASGSSSRRRAPAEELPEAARPLFEKLRARRAELAKACGVPPYVVAHDRTLVDMAMRRPRTLEALSGVFGFGPSRIEQYGAALLAALDDAS